MGVLQSTGVNKKGGVLVEKIATPSGILDRFHKKMHRVKSYLT